MKGGILKPGRATGPIEYSDNIDPVCGAELKERDPQRSSLLKDRILFFCSPDCKRRFDVNASEWTERLKATAHA